MSLQDVAALLEQHGVRRRKPELLGGYPRDLAPQRLWVEWTRLYDAYRLQLVGRVPQHVLATRPAAEVRKLLVQRDCTAARLAERDLNREVT